MHRDPGIIRASEEPLELKLAQEVLDRGGSRHMEWGATVLYMPPRHRDYWGRIYPELNSLDPEIKLNAWKKFLKSSESKPYRTFKPRYFHGLGQPQNRPGILLPSG